MLYFRIAITTALLSVVACGGDAALDSFAIRLALDVGEADSTCVAAGCDDYSLLCNAAVGIKIREVPGLGADAGPPALLTQQCVRVAGGSSETLCALGTIDVSLDAVPRRRGTIEIAVWPDSGSSEPSCPELSFDAAGRPLPGGLAPAFARREFFDFGGDDEVAVVRLSCLAPSLVADDECVPRPVKVNANILDFTKLISLIGEAARNINVSIGVPELTDTGEYQLLQGNAQRLALSQVVVGTAPSWEGTLEETSSLATELCVIVLDQVMPTQRAPVTCQSLRAGELDVLLTGYGVPAALIDDLVAAAGLDEVPDTGMVVGRVVLDGQPLAGVTLATTAPSPTIRYFDADISTSEGLTATSESGYFIATEVPFGTAWSASHAEGYTAPDDPPPVAGQLLNRLTMLVIRMQRPPMLTGDPIR